MSEALTVPDGLDPMEHRAEMTAKYAERTFDMMVSSWACSACGAPIPPPPPLVVPFAEYRSLPQATEATVKATEAAIADGGEHDPCGKCGAPSKLVAADMFIFCSAIGADLVVRAAPGRAPELLRWSKGAGFAPLVVTPAVDVAVARDATLRTIFAKKDDQDDAAGFAVLQAAIATMPGEPMLLKLLPWVNRVGNLDLSRAVAAAHVAAKPDDADGHYWLAQATVESVAKGVMPRDAIADAVPELERAVALKPDYPDALIGLANVARIRGRDDDAEKALRALIAKHPEHPEGNYTLGLVLLAKSPAEALACFERGEKSSPDDADYPRSRARALIALNRPDEARAAIARARELAPNDPRIDQVAAQIMTGAQRSMTTGIRAFVGLIFVGVLVTIAWFVYPMIVGGGKSHAPPRPAAHAPAKRH